MPLGKVFTQLKVRQTLLLWVKEISEQNLEPDLVNDFIDLATLDVAEVLNGATIPDYGRTTTLNNAASSFLATVVTGGGYTHTTRTITKTSHGLTAADVGKRIVFWDATSDPIANIAIAQIESITDANNFVVSSANTSDTIASPDCDYAVFSVHSGTYFDLSSIKLSHITKISDTNNGEWIMVKSREFNNLANFPQKQKNIYWYRHGETVYFYTGTSAENIGTITLEYFGYPALPSAETDYLDIRDQYIPLVMAKVKNYIYEHLDKTPPEGLTGVISQKTAQIREANLAEKQAAKMST